MISAASTPNIQTYSPMEKRILEYPLLADLYRPTALRPVEIPTGGEIIGVVATDHDDPVLLVLVPCVSAGETPATTRYFEVFRSDEPIRYGMGVDRIYLGSVTLTANGKTRWATQLYHIFEYTGV
jgi:hypothetical protein